MSYNHLAKNETVRLGLLLLIVVLVSTLALLGQSASRTSHAASRERPDASANQPDVDQASRLRAGAEYGKLPLSFEVNRGQTDSQVQFLSRGAGYTLFLTPTKAVLSLEQQTPESPKSKASQKHESVHRVANVLRMALVGANPAAKVAGRDQLSGKSNYFIGNDPKKWQVNVPTFARVYYQDIYKGVDLVYYGNQRQLENDFVVAPGADPGVIALAFEGANKITTDAAGNLVLATAGGQVQLQKPVIYQLTQGARREVAGNYVMKNRRTVGFEVGNYDPTQPLVIDPVLVYSTFLGGTGQDFAYGIALDPSGNAYVTGSTESANFPTFNSNQSFGGFQDAFISKFNAAGSALIYSTYLGGRVVNNSSEIAYDIAVDGVGNAYVTGTTDAADFPTTANAFQPTKLTGSGAAFVTKLGTNGALAYSTYLSGAQFSRGFGIATDGAGNAYVTGQTTSSSLFPFPVTNSAFQSIGTGFVTKLNTNASGAASLVYSSCLAVTGGGTDGHGIVADATGNVYVTGVTSTLANFASAGAFQTTLGGGTFDAFVEKFNTNLSGAASRVYSTYLGGSGQDFGGNLVAAGSKAIAIDAAGNAYVTGQTKSTNFPVLNAFQATNAGYVDAFLTKLNATGSALIYSTYLGGNDLSNADGGLAVAVNAVGNAYVVGQTRSDNFPTFFPIVPVQTTGRAFVAKFTPAGNALVYLTRLGASTGIDDAANGIALDGAGNAFVTGNARTGYPTTAGAFQPVNPGVNDAFVSQIADPTIIGRVVDEDGNPIPGATVNLTGVPSATVTTDANGYYTFGLLTVANNYTVSVTVANYIFNSQAVNNLQKNVRVDFGPVVATVSGQVTIINTSTGLSGVTMTLTGGKTLSVQTDGSGNYSFSNLPTGRNYDVGAMKLGFGFQAGYVFQPTHTIFPNLLANQTANFVAIPPTIQFSATNYPVNEGDGKVTLTVTRSGDTSGASSVDYATNPGAPPASCGTNNGIASERCDYTMTLGTLQFAANETSKTVPIFITDDANSEGTETFTVTLSNPTAGFTIATPGTTTVTITDNDGANGQSPVKNGGSFNNSFFVRQQYIDFLNREPDAGGLAFWKNQLDECENMPLPGGFTDAQNCREVRRINVSAAFFVSIEFQSTGYLVYRFNQATFNLGPTLQVRGFLKDTQEIQRGVIVGQGNWQQQLEDNKVAFANAFVARPQFIAAFPTSLTAAAFVDALNANTKDPANPTTGSLTQAERDSLVATLSANPSSTTLRAQVLRSIAENSLFQQREFNRAFVLMQYFGYLRRNPNALPDTDFGGYNFWLGKLNQFNGNFVNAELVKAFITSGEYINRFGL